MPIWLQAGLWGLLAGGALVIGALVAWLFPVPRKLVASVMAFGAGVLISALAFDLVDEAETSGGLVPTVIGFLAGAVVYVAANIVLARHGARHRKRSGDQQPSEAEQGGSGAAIAIGALLDGIPESVVLGLSLARRRWRRGSGASRDLHLQPARGALQRRRHEAQRQKRRLRLRRLDRHRRRQRTRRTLGCLLLQGAAAATIAVITAIAAGAILAMIADTMIPEAFERTHMYAGLIATVGFLVAFTISRAG